MKSLGVDEVYCLSVNDAFVMRQWGLSQGLEEVRTNVERRAARSSIVWY